jgi:DNA protecting protein DprA
MKEIQSRLALFAAIEGGHIFWSQEIASNGADFVFQKLLKGGYDKVKFSKTMERLAAIDVDEIGKRIENTGAIFLTPEMEQWPEQLNELAAPPIGLVVKGEVEILTGRGLAIVGTRNPTPYGIRNAGDFAAGFVDREWTIISGGAYGIDSAAHKGALVAEGSTVAVLAAGVDVAYPAGNARLFAEISENGALVSEVLPGVHAIPSRFLTRNRIIAALSQATLVVEAAFRSGSLRTARDAAELMRPVMAIPGPISAPTSEGCHRLIGERAAELVTSVADAIELISTL